MVDDLKAAILARLFCDAWVYKFSLDNKTANHH